MNKEKMSILFRSPRARGGLIAALVAAAFAGGLALSGMFNEVSTDDAFIEGHVIPISPKVSGHAVKVAVLDNQPVKAGDLLVQIDEKDYRIKGDLARAQLAAAQAEAEQSAQDAERFTKLFATGDVSQQQLDKALLRKNTGAAQLQAAQAQLNQAELNLSDTKILAPAGGQVTRKSVEEGAFLVVGQVLMAVIPGDRWVIANLKETQLTDVRPGQKVEIRVDAYPGKVWRGHVDSIQRGTGSRFSLLPAENATGNYIKVTQRVPVKILIDETPDSESVLALGMSVVPVIKLK